MQNSFKKDLSEKLPPCGENTDFCPFLRKPYNECYSIKLTSQSILSVMRYCIKDFTKCKIYKKNIQDAEKVI
jgi:hypothetical protein